MIRLCRTLTLTMILGLATTSAFGQAAPPAEAGAEEGTGGGPLPGYVATGFLAAAAMFVLCKSARR